MLGFEPRANLAETTLRGQERRMKSDENLSGYERGDLGRGTVLGGGRERSWGGNVGGRGTCTGFEGEP